MTLPFVPVVPRDFDALGRWFNRVFQAFSANAGVWLLQGFIYLVITIVLVAIPIFALAFSAPALAPLLQQGRPPSPAELLPLIGAFSGAFIIVILLSWVVSSFLIAGFVRTALKQLRGETTSVGDLFGAGYAFLPMLGATLLTGLALAISFTLCIVPGFFVAPLFLLVYPIIVDRREGTMRGLSLSFETITKNYWLFFVYTLIFGLIVFVVNFILNLIPFASILLTMVLLPFSALIGTVPYTEIFYPAGQVPQYEQAGPQAYMPPAYTPPPGETPPDETPKQTPPDENAL